MCVWESERERVCVFVEREERAYSLICWFTAPMAIVAKAKPGQVQDQKPSADLSWEQQGSNYVNHHLRPPRVQEQEADTGNRAEAWTQALRYWRQACEAASQPQHQMPTPKMCVCVYVYIDTHTHIYRYIVSLYRDIHICVCILKLPT